MGLARLKTKISVEDYLEGEKISPQKYEYIDGEVYAMAGASEKHHRISANIFKRIDDRLENSDCQAFITDMKLRVSEATFYYPDVFVDCTENPESEFYRTNPVLIIEVVSPSTQQIDRREKMRVYQQIPSVLEYVIVEQDKISVEIHRRESDGNWITYFYDESDLNEQIEFQSVDFRTTLAEIYRRVRFENPTVEPLQ